ncbi:MAG TPA: helix-turn-helix domain-containing protein [Myxococcota bacterium]|nr:helix-turn-helix domain-containing protein [Myxococcota bacterium]
MATPRPGAPVRGSRTGRPIMAALDLLGRRWALRVLWELRDGAQSFRALQARCDEVSPTVLNARLRELRESGIVRHASGSGYALSEAGESLLAALAPLSDWAARWARARHR